MTAQKQFKSFGGKMFTILNIDIVFKNVNN